MIELWILSSAFQSVGNARTPMIVMVIVNILNIILNPTLIFGFGVVPAFGVAGSALATISSRSLGLLLLVFVVMGGKTPLTFPRSFRPDLSVVVRLFRVAIPNSVQSGMRSLSFMLLMAVVAVFGASAISAYGIAIRLEFIALMPGFAIATAAAVLVGQNIGACRIERAESGVRYALLSYGAIMALTACAYYLFAGDLIRFFDPSGASTAVGVAYLHTITPFYLLNAVAIVLSFAMNGAGATAYPMYATTIALIVIQIPLAVVLPGLLGTGIEGVWIAVVVAIVVQFALLGYLYRQGRWKHTCL
jgi:putative MATE family efflux protein